MSLVVLMLTVATFVPALDPMYGTPCSRTRLEKVLCVFLSLIYFPFSFGFIYDAV